jgi:hypothetical protein
VSQSTRRDPAVCREDLVRKAAAAGASFRSAFDWINVKEALRAANDPRNRGLTAVAIRELAEEWILAGNAIKCVPEGRELYKEKRHFYYFVIVGNLADFPRGLFVEMELCNCDEEDPTVALLGAHPPSF